MDYISKLMVDQFWYLYTSIKLFTLKLLHSPEATKQAQSQQKLEIYTDFYWLFKFIKESLSLSFILLAVLQFRNDCLTILSQKWVTFFKERKVFIVIE